MSSHNISQQYQHLFNQQAPHHLSLAMIDYLESYDDRPSFHEQMESLSAAAQLSCAEKLEAQNLIDVLWSEKILRIPVRIHGYIYELDTALELLKRGNGTAREAFSNKYPFSYQDIQPAMDLKDKIQTQIDRARNEAPTLPVNEKKVEAAASISSELNHSIVLPNDENAARSERALETVSVLAAEDSDDEAITLQILSDAHLALQMSQVLDDDSFSPDHQNNVAANGIRSSSASPLSAELNPHLLDEGAEQRELSENEAEEYAVEASFISHANEEQNNIEHISTRIKCVVVGDKISEKNRLCYRAQHNVDPAYVPTVLDNVNLVIHSPEGTVVMSVYSTEGQEEYDRLRPLNYPQTDVFLLTYSVTSQESFNNIRAKWLPELRYLCPDVPIILVACHREQREAAGQQAISTQQGEVLAQAIGATYVECSARTGENIQEVFAAAVHSVQAKEAANTVAPHRPSREGLSNSFLGLFNPKPKLNAQPGNLIGELEDYIAKKARGGPHTSVFERIRGINKNIQISAAQNLLANLKGAFPQRKFSAEAINALLTEDLGAIVTKHPAIVQRIQGEWRETISAVQSSASMRSESRRF